MKALLLLGKKLKDDDVIELLEFDDLSVVYDFDRSHENMPDSYWAAAHEAGYQLHFDADQILRTIFLYVQPKNGFSEVARDKVEDVSFFESAAEVETHCRTNHLKITQGRGKLPGFEPTQWARIEEADRRIHYEYRAGQLALVTLSLETNTDLAT